MGVKCVGGVISPVCTVLLFFHDSRLHVLAEPRETRSLAPEQTKAGKEGVCLSFLLLCIKACLSVIPTFLCVFSRCARQIYGFLLENYCDSLSKCWTLWDTERTIKAHNHFQTKSFCAVRVDTAQVSLTFIMRINSPVEEVFPPWRLPSFRPTVRKNAHWCLGEPATLCWPQVWVWVVVWVLAGITPPMTSKGKSSRKWMDRHKS